MADETNTTNTDAQVAAQNQAAADSANPTNGAIAASAASAPNTVSTSAATGAADNSAASFGNGVGESSTSTNAGASGEAQNPSAAASTVSGSNPNSTAAASTSSGAPTLSGSVTNAGVASVDADSNFINNPASQQPSTAGTSGKLGNTTGIATDAGVEKLTPAQAANAGSNLGVDANANVRYPAAPHPIVHEVQKRTAELKAIVGQQELTPWIQRALKDLQTFEEWVVQHFEEIKRKV